MSTQEGLFRRRGEGLVLRAPEAPLQTLPRTEQTEAQGPSTGGSLLPHSLI